MLALAHERRCERELAEELARVLEAGDLPDLAALHATFAPDPARLPIVSVRQVSLESYQDLVETADQIGAVAGRTHIPSTRPGSASC